MSAIPMISIIDDNEEVRVATESLVQSCGLDSHSFASARDFLESPLLDSTDCLVSDVQMPEMSGLELQAVLLASGHALPIIFITAFPEERVRANALAQGAVAFLSKPFDGDLLLRHIGDALKAAR